MPENLTSMFGSDRNCMDIKWKEQNCRQDTYTLIITVLYFALTTLSTIGYGDLYPISIVEQILGIIFMLCGIVFFSQVMGSFIEIITNYDQQMGNDNKKDVTELNNWMILLTRFNNIPLPKHLINQINGHFSFFWAHDRLG